MFRLKPQKLDRYFGKCRIRGCPFRRVIDGQPFVDGELIFYQGHNEAALRRLGLWCEEHNTWMKFSQLEGRLNPEKECNGRCMGAVGPACDCACGGENHGKNHVGI